MNIPFKRKGPTSNDGHGDEDVEANLEQPKLSVVLNAINMYWCFIGANRCSE